MVFLRFLFMIFFTAICFCYNGVLAQHGAVNNLFPDGTKITAWFNDASGIVPEAAVKKFIITDFGATIDSNRLQTAVIQKTIDAAHSSGGGIIVIPDGVFLSGALFFKPGTRLFLSGGAVLKGSDNIADYPEIPSRMEGQNIYYFAALVNAYANEGFTISGTGTIDGNGLNFWEAFWQRRKENPKCTNLEVSRPRLVFVWNCNNVQITDVRLQNAGFWTTHLYQCNNVKLYRLRITSPHEPVKAPSTDAIDLDVCNNVHIKDCYMAVNDDAIALKGGKGPWADTQQGNGGNSNIVIENCEFGFCHSALTLGSEAIHNRNIIMRNCVVTNAVRVLWLKMRPDTPQLYEYISVENIEGNARSFVYVKPWTQFFDLKGRVDTPLSVSKNVYLKNISLKCDVFYDITPGKSDRLSNFTFENLNIQAGNGAVNKSYIKNLQLKNVVVNGKELK